MILRTEFTNKSEEILSFIDSYGAVRHEHFEKFFPECGKNLSYLLKNFRLHISPDGKYISTNENPCPDKCLIASLGVLADLFGKVQRHARATPPAQISFLTHSGDYYEIIYVGYGMEAMIETFFETQLAAKPPKNHKYATKRIVIIEDKNQMERLYSAQPEQQRIPGITRFALIQPDGSLSYFNGS